MLNTENLQRHYPYGERPGSVLAEGGGMDKFKARQMIRDGQHAQALDALSMEVWAADGFISIPGRAVELSGGRLTLNGPEPEREDIPFGFHEEDIEA